MKINNTKGKKINIPKMQQWEKEWRSYIHKHWVSSMVLKDKFRLKYYKENKTVLIVDRNFGHKIIKKFLEDVLVKPPTGGKE